MEHPDFRVAGRIFATLGYPDAAWGMVKLTPEQQRKWVAEFPEIFVACNGAWGRAGATQVRLAEAPVKDVRAAIAAAWETVGAKAGKRKTR